MKTAYGVIYSVTNTINNKKYIGQTTQGLKRRKSGHMCSTKNGSELAIHRAIRKYGKENFKWKVIDSAKNQHELDEKEIYWIKNCNTFYEGGYNLATGGESPIYSIANIQFL